MQEEMTQEEAVAMLRIIGTSGATPDEATLLSAAGVDGCLLVTDTHKRPAEVPKYQWRCAFRIATGVGVGYGETKESAIAAAWEDYRTKARRYPQ